MMVPIIYDSKYNNNDINSSDINKITNFYIIVIIMIKMIL